MSAQKRYDIFRGFSVRSDPEVPLVMEQGSCPLFYWAQMALVWREYTDVINYCPQIHTKLFSKIALLAFLTI